VYIDIVWFATLVGVVGAVGWFLGLRYGSYRSATASRAAIFNWAKICEENGWTLVKTSDWFISVKGIEGVENTASLPHELTVLNVASLQDIIEYKNMRKKWIP
jgi:hypothetical protein